MLEEEAVKQIVRCYCIRCLFFSVLIGCCRSGLDNGFAVSKTLNKRIVERVDVNRQSSGVLGQDCGVRHLAKTEATGVVGSHRCLIVGIVVVNKRDEFDGIFCIVEFAEDVNEVCGNSLVADNLSKPDLLQ